MGALCLKRPWPGMARTIYGSHQRYVETYLKPSPGYYFTGDGAHRYARAARLTAHRGCGSSRRGGLWRGVILV